MTYETIRWEQTDGVGHVTLSRPDALNAWNRQFSRDLRDVFAGEATDDSVRAVLVTGAGRAFSAGGDMKQVPELADDGFPDMIGPMTRESNPAAVAARRLDKPVVAAVHGAVLGLGCSFALACDFIVAAESAFFEQAFVHRGVIPDGGATMLLPRAIGKARAFEMAMLGTRIDAATALEWRLVNSVVPDDQLVAEAHKLTERLAAGPTRAYAAMKRAFNQTVYAGLDEQLDLEARLQHDLVLTADFAEGIVSFLEKREPNFAGR